MESEELTPPKRIKHFTRICKLGTHNSTLMRIQGKEKDLVVGARIKAMKEETFSSLHRSWRINPACNAWQDYRVTDINDACVFLSL